MPYLVVYPQSYVFKLTSQSVKALKMRQAYLAKRIIFRTFA
ncbi:hypothetical protein HMPREF1991_02707 [Hoylesella loescheii DSM 19665 = JCM 12249 = ATCC 15930]|uniref:Uncharacterized protein n=1 Tax=Hoylesella loescheii DSM 19665 = JCM 12249 = ATCC 15930 TaxID=1122985 RepID=A0A069QGV8_HOYLO|nr:hypothetical protein HMPREF1991_02707 [Hoylesella loescheii DSM 19665 = JCM 12249 = ATCC 15930]